MNFLKKFTMDKISELVDNLGKAADNVSTTQEEYNQQTNERYDSDLQSDSWLAKNIRPIILLSLLVLWLSIILFNIEVSASILTSIENLTNIAFMFYFGSRAGEKIMKINARRRKK